MRETQLIARQEKAGLVGCTPAEAAQHFARRFHIDRQTAMADYEQMQRSILSIAQAGAECCPVTYLEVERIEPMTAELSAP